MQCMTHKFDIGASVKNNCLINTAQYGGLVLMAIVVW